MPNVYVALQKVHLLLIVSCLTLILIEFVCIEFQNPKHCIDPSCQTQVDIFRHPLGFQWLFRIPEQFSRPYYLNQK